MYEIRYIHRGELRDLRLIEPSGDFLLHRLDDLNRNTQQMIKGNLRVVNEISYLITPLRSGTIEIPAFR